MSKVLELSGIHKSFTQGEEKLSVLDNIKMNVKKGEIVALVGPSGSGKTTLLQIAGLLDNPDDGTVNIGGESFEKANDAKRTKARREHIGFVYQFHHLLPEFDATENVMMPMLINKQNKQEAKDKANGLLADMGLADRISHRPSQLSGGQQQRVAIARALANDPALLLADEPTGNLDHNTSDQVFEFLQKLVKKNKCGALIATHNMELVKKMDRVLKIQDGAVK